MTKIELAIATTNWKIESAEKTISEMQENIKNHIDDPHPEFNAESILAYARRMQDAVKELLALREQKKMLESLAEE